MTETATAPRYAIVELMGHRRYGARVEEVTAFGLTMLRAHVLAEPPFVQDVHPQAIYGLTYCDEAAARRANSAWIVPQEIRPALPARAGRDDEDDEPEDVDPEHLTDALSDVGIAVSEATVRGWPPAQRVAARQFVTAADGAALFGGDGPEVPAFLAPLVAPCGPSDPDGRVGEREADAIDAEETQRERDGAVLRDLLANAWLDVPMEAIRGWEDDQRAQARAWAQGEREYLDAWGHASHPESRPAFLAGYPATAPAPEPADVGITL